MTTRREFLATSAAGALGLGLTPGAAHGAGTLSPGAGARTEPRERPVRAIRLLILGGTGFIGPWQVRYAQQRGHEVTIFNRGRSAPGMFPGVEELIGDRDTGNLEALRGRRWDAVIDNSASQGDAPRWVRPADRVNPRDRAAAPRSPGLSSPTRPQPGAPPAAAMPRSRGLGADNPGAARSRQPQLDRRDRPGSQQRVQPQGQRRVDRDRAARPALQDPRPSMPPRVDRQQRRQTVNAPPSSSDARREFRGAPPRQQDSRRGRAGRSPAATERGTDSTAPPRRERPVRDANRGSRDGSAIGARQGRPAAR